MNIHIISFVIFVLYLVFMLGVGCYFLNKNRSQKDYYVGGRNMSAGHIGLSVVAIDVGGFSIGLGGLGFVMVLSGSWMLFTGVLVAWLSACLLIPKVYPLAKKHRFLMFPEFLAHYYNTKVALIAGIISLLGYIGFTSSQILAGAKLAAATFPDIAITNAILIMGVIAVIYTVIGGIKAVIYTDTIQWIILMVGLVGIGIPIGFIEIGGRNAIRETLPVEFLSLHNIRFIDLFNWCITIVPIWFVGMTLYQRIYACKDEQTAKKAWLIAGLFEYPVTAFMGVALGLFSRVALEQGMFTSIGYASDTSMDPELGLPLLLRTILPVGLMGLMMSAYFSAIMSTADSCLMGASGNLTTDIFGYSKGTIRIRNSQFITFLIGVLAIIIATKMENVLEWMLYSYAFMVSGLLGPVLGTLWFKKPSSLAALVGMILGGSITLTLILLNLKLPYGLDANFFGVSSAAISFFSIQYSKKKNRNDE